MSLGEWPSEPAAPEAKGRPVVAHTRKAASRRNDDESVPFFDETRVPVEVIELSAPETDGLSPEDYEIASTNASPTRVSPSSRAARSSTSRRRWG